MSLYFLLNKNNEGENSLTGEIPSEFGEIEQLQILNLGELALFEFTSTKSECLRYI